MDKIDIHSLNTIDEKLVNLKIISKIKKDDKLLCTGELLEIDDSQWMIQGLARWYSKASRRQTIDKINLVINDVFVFIDKTLKDELTHTAGTRSDNILKEDNSEILQKFLLYLNNSIEGLENLKITYEEDESIICKLDVLIDKIKMKLDKMNKILRIKI
jgi:hypothetical protein